MWEVGSNCLFAHNLLIPDLKGNIHNFFVYDTSSDNLQNFVKALHQIIDAVKDAESEVLQKFKPVVCLDNYSGLYLKVGVRG